MPNKKISQLVNKTTILSTDLFPIGDATSGQLYKKTIAELQAAIGGAVISVNGLVGTVVLDTDDIQELATPTNKYFTDARARAALSATSPLAFNSSTGVFSMPAATTSANGYLTSTDWNTFNGKENVLTFSSPLVRTSNTISMPAATTSVNGYLSSTDWNTFNNKQGALTLTVTGSSGSSTLIGNTLNVPTYTLAGLGGIGASFLSGGTGITYNSGTGVIATTITQYTDALARASLSFTAGSGAYNSTTGVITIPTNTNQLTNGASFITLGSLSGGTGISYNNTTGVITNTITQYTDALARGAISLTTTGTSGASTYNSTTGVLNIPNYGSALSGYLPLTGGTLTGNLNGTSATFTSNVTIRPATGYNAYFQNSGTTLRINYLNDALSSNISASYRATDYVFQDGSGSAILTLASNNSATFSSSLTATSGTFVTSGTKSTVSIGNTATSTYSQLLMYGGATKYNWSLGAQYNTNNAFEITPSTATEGTTFSTPALTVLQSGNVGIGTTSPAGRLTVTGPNSAGISIDQSNYNYYGAYSHIFLSSAYATEYLRITNTGNLLVGTTTDSGYKLDVNGTGRFSGAVRLAADVWNTSSDGLQRLYFSANSNTYLKGAGVIIRDNNDLNMLTIVTGGAATFSSNVEIGQSATVRGYTGTTGAGMFFAYGSAGAGIGSIYSYNYSTSTYGGTVIDGSYVALYNSGSEKMRITGGNVGIGTTSPAQKFEVSGGAIIASGFGNRASGTGKALEIGMDGTQGLLQAIDRTTSSAIPIYISASATYIMGGNCGIGTSSPAYKLDIYGGTNNNSVLRLDATGGNGYGGQIQFYSKTTGGTTNTWTLGTGVSGGANTIELYNGTSAILSATIGGNILLGTLTDNGERLYVSGNIRATGTITANSDIRLKKNLERIENALEKVGQISGYTYNTIYDDKRHGGVIAQEIDEVFPEIVNKGNDGLLGVEYGNISALLIEALKEATTKIKALESKVEALQNL